jgi:hypothetical protein
MAKVDRLPVGSSAGPDEVLWEWDRVVLSCS